VLTKNRNPAAKDTQFGAVRRDVLREAGDELETVSSAARSGIVGAFG
jgi:hypothetical protein